MNKEQALHGFWSSFNIPAYDENTIPENITENGTKTGIDLPYITYSVAVDDFQYPVSLSASIWYRGTSWSAITNKLHEIAEAIGQGGKTIPFDDGVIWIVRGTPFAQRMSDPDDSIRRILININAEYIS